MNLCARRPAGRTTSRARASTRSCSSTRPGPRSGPDGGSGSLRWWTRNDSIRTLVRTPIEADFIEVFEPPRVPGYRSPSRKAASARVPGQPDRCVHGRHGQDGGQGDSLVREPVVSFRLTFRRRGQWSCRARPFPTALSCSAAPYTRLEGSLVDLYIVEPTGRWRLIDPDSGQPVCICPVCWPAAERVLRRGGGLTVRQLVPRPSWARCGICDPDDPCWFFIPARAGHKGPPQDLFAR